MTSPSKIQWCSHTANPIRPVIDGRVKGYYCEAVAPECSGCYAEAFNQNAFFGGNGLRFTQTGESPEHVLNEGMLEGWCAPRARPKVIFLESMSDLGGHWVKEEWVQQVLDAQLKGRRNVYMNLSKRPDRMFFSVQRFLHRHGLDTLPQHIGIGTSAGTQASYRRFMPWLLATPAQYRFWSAEPLLEDIWIEEGLSCDALESPVFPFSNGSGGPRLRPLIHQCIIGGQSGKDLLKVKPFHLEHATSLSEQLRMLSPSTRIFWKQMGSKPIWNGERILLPGKGGDPDFWPAGVPYFLEVPDHLQEIMIAQGKRVEVAPASA